MVTHDSVDIPIHICATVLQSAVYVKPVLTSNATIIEHYTGSEGEYWKKFGILYKSK